MSALETYQWMLRICAIGIAIDVLEQVVRHRSFADGGLYAWSVLRRRLDLAPRIVRGAADALCTGARRPMVVFALRAIGVGLIVAWPAGSTPFAAGLTGLVATQLYIFLRRSGFGLDGADQMNLVVLGASWLAVVVDGSPDGLRIGLWFIVVQSMLSYAINGLAKLYAPSWRSGRAFSAVFSTHSNGQPAMYRIFAVRPRLARALCWLTIAWECGFPIVLVVPDPIRIPLLISGVLFHLSVAVGMGIHLFVWAFVAPYVAIWTVTR